VGLGVAFAGSARIGCLAMTAWARGPVSPCCEVPWANVWAQHLVFPPIPQPLSAPAGAERGARLWFSRAGYALLTREVAVRFFVPALVNRLS